MLWIHPFIQCVATILALYALLLGIKSFRRLHLQHKTRFNWRLHVRVGIIALFLWSIGIVIGLVVVKQNWHGYLITGSHGHRMFYILPLISASFASGWYMHKYRKKGVIFPLVHACTNVLLLLLVFFQAISGWQVYQAFVLGV